MGCRLGIEFDARNDTMTVDLGSVLLKAIPSAEVLKSGECKSNQKVEMKCVLTHKSHYHDGTSDESTDLDAEMASRHRSLVALNADYRLNSGLLRCNIRSVRLTALIGSNWTTADVDPGGRPLLDLSIERLIPKLKKGRVRKKRVNSQHIKKQTSQDGSHPLDIARPDNGDVNSEGRKQNRFLVTASVDNRDGVADIEPEHGEDTPVPRSTKLVQQKNINGYSSSNTIICAAVTERKRVSFADECGKSLTDVWVVDERSEVAHQMDWSIVGELCPDGGHHPSGPPSREIGWVAAFPPPASSYGQFWSNLGRQFVALENVFVQGSLPPRVQGTVKVKNLCFEKHVFVRWSTDGWHTTEDTQAHFMSSLPGDDYDTFAFDFVVVLSGLNDQRIDFCVGFRANDCEYWDNNNCKNFTICHGSIHSDSYGTGSTGVAETANGEHFANNPALDNGTRSCYY